MIITIDGPAGSGKSTAARGLAACLGIAYLDTGAMYRAVTLKAMRDGADLHDEQALALIARTMKLEIGPQPDGMSVSLDGQDVTNEIRSPEITDQTHYAASSPAVREALVELQRSIGRRLGSFVAEGRDQGSVVFPDADVKFYLKANPAVRAERRRAELHRSGQQVTLQEILTAIEQRDRRDEGRQVGPLVKPPGAIEIDTTDNTIAQTRRQLLSHLEAAK